MDANVVRVLAEKYGLKVKWQLRGNKNAGLSSLDYDVSWINFLTG